MLRRIARKSADETGASGMASSMEWLVVGRSAWFAIALRGAAHERRILQEEVAAEAMDGRC